MRTLLLMALAAFLAVAPLTAEAQTVPVPTPPPASATIFGLPPAQALAVGVGIIAGGVGVSALSSGPFSTVVGAVAGALIGNWWYATQPMPGVRGATPMRHQMSADAAF